MRTQDAPEDIARVCEALRVANTVSVGVLEQRLGEPPVFVPVTGPAPDIEEVLRRARAVELFSLLRWGRGIWTPPDYHFQLPLGAHVSTFVKVGNAIRVPRDGYVLASWFDPYLADGVGIVTDSRTMTGLVSALELRLALNDWKVSDVAVLEKYPATQLDVAEAVTRVAAQASRILAILSVSSSGRILEKIKTALTAGHPEVPLPASHIEVLVDVHREARRAREAWLPGPFVGLQPEFGGDTPRTCVLCADPERSYVVPIDPETFEGVIPAEVAPTMPAFRALSNNDTFWEEAAAAGAVEVEAQPDPWTLETRATPALPLKVNWTKLTLSQTFPQKAAAKIAEAVDGIRDWELPDLVLVPQGEALIEGYERFWGRISPALGNPKKLSFGQEEWDEEAIRTVTGAKRILIFCLGAVTGSSLQSGILRVQRQREDSEYRVFGFALHSRPTSGGTWKDLLNFFDKRLGFGWQTFLPLDWSPLREENRLLSSIDIGPLSDAGQRFVDQRRVLCRAAVDLRREPLFWGGTPADALSGHALPGDRLDAVTTYAAMGTAIQTARVAEIDRRPLRRVIDLPRALRSYFDDLILASILRWVHPHEAHWGWREDVSGLVLGQVLQRTPAQRRLMILSESLLALATAKIPSHSRSLLEAHANALRDDDSGELPPPLEVGLAVVNAQLGSEPNL